MWPTIPHEADELKTARRATLSTAGAARLGPAVEHVGAERVTGGDIWVVEIVRLVTRHPKSLHDPA
jgi:hypothetical protein